MLRIEPRCASLAPLGWRLRPGFQIRACALALACGLHIAANVAMSSRLSLLHHLARDCSPCPRAVKARLAVSSAAPVGRTNLSLSSLTAHARGFLAVAGDELRKDGGNRASRVPRANRTEQPNGWAPNLGIRCAV